MSAGVPAAVASGRGRASGIATLVVYLAFAAWESGVAADLGTRLYVGPDPAKDAFSLHRVTSRLLHDPARVFDGGTFFPSRESILYSDPLLGQALLLLPLRPFTDNPIALYNAALLAVLALSSFGFHRLAFRLTGSRAASLLAGIAIPYTARQTAELAHLNLVATAGFPFLLDGLLRLLERPGPRAALLTGAAFAWQAASSGYHALSCVLMSLVVAAWGWRALLLRRGWAWAVASAALAACLLAPYLLGMARLDAGEGRFERGIDEIQGGALELPRGLFGTHALLWRGLLPADPPVFPGVTVVSLAALGIVRAGRRERVVSMLVALSGLSLLFALGPDLSLFGRVVMPLPYRFLWERVPLFAAARHPVTFVFLGAMALGLLAAIGLSVTPALRRPIPACAILLSAAAETLVAAPPREFRSTDMPPIYARLQKLEPGAVLELPDDGDAQQWWALGHGRPIVWAAAAFWPVRHVNLQQQLRKRWRRRPPADLEDEPSLEYLKQHFPVRYLIVHWGVSGYVRQSVGMTPKSFELLAETPDGDQLYRLHRSGAGKMLPRSFRDDQVREGAVWAMAKGAIGSRIRLRWNGQDLGTRPLAATTARHEWTLSPASIAPGLNQARFEVVAGDPAAELVLEDCGSR